MAQRKFRLVKIRPDDLDRTEEEVNALETEGYLLGAVHQACVIMVWPDKTQEEAIREVLEKAATQFSPPPQDPGEIIQLPGLE